MQTGEFERIGKRLFAEHLVNGNFGNMSLREDDGFFITRTGSFLDTPGDLVFVRDNSDVPKLASSEWRVHRAVYEKTHHLAIVHAHPPYAVAASMICERIEPIDSEGKMFLPIIPVAVGDPGTQDLADEVADCLSLGGLCIAFGHGTFAAGKTLEEAYLKTSLAEHACRTLALTKSGGF